MYTFLVSSDVAAYCIFFIDPSFSIKLWSSSFIVLLNLKFASVILLVSVFTIR